MNGKGTKNRVKFTTFGLEDRTEDKKELDLYETNPIYVDYLLDFEEYGEGNYYEPCNGLNKYIENHLLSKGYEVTGSDLMWGDDFLNWNGYCDYIITNPPFNLSLEFVEKMFNCVDKKFSLLVPLNYLDTMKRYHIFTDKVWGVKSVLIFSKRISFQKGGGLPEKCITGMSFCWITWEKNYKEKTELKWIKNFVEKNK
jgi:hypothetical protein